MAEVSPGTYWVKEVTAPPGYNLDSTAHQITVEKGAEKTVTLTDTPKYAEAYLEKRPEKTQIDYITEVPVNYTLKGAVYEVFTDSACTKAAVDINGKTVVFTTDEKGRILVPVAVIANGSDEVIEFNIEDVYGDVTETITELVDEINKRYGEGSDVDVKLAEFFNDVKESNNFQTYIDETKSSLYASIDKYLTRLEKHILRVFNNAHRSLYITMFGKQNDAIALLSMNLDLPTKAEAGELTLVPTTYSLQYFAPVYKKFVAVTNVYDAKTKAELDLGEAQSLAAVANSGENMLKVVDGLKNCTIKGETGKIYEITYTAVDFLGVVMIKKFYVEF